VEHKKEKQINWDLGSSRRKMLENEEFACDSQQRDSKEILQAFWWKKEVRNER